METRGGQRPGPRRARSAPLAAVAGSGIRQRDGGGSTGRIQID